ncbi:MAG: glycosyltransferase, partial [Chloroflexota bacterium]
MLFIVLRPMLVTHVFKATGLSGAEGHLIALATGLRAEGIELRWIVLVDRKRPPTALFEAAQARGIPFDVVPIAHDLDLGVARRIALLLKTCGAQIAHTHMIHGDLYGTLAARLVGIPIVQSRHNDDKFRRIWILRGLMNLLSSQARTVIAISESLAAFTRDVEGVPASKITRIYYGIDPAELTSRAEAGALRTGLGVGATTLLVAAVGRLTAQKGFQFLIEAFARVRKSLPAARLVIAGDGELRFSLEAQAAALGISQSVRFLG